MWCTRCHADMAAELAEGGQSLNCTQCGHEIQKVYTPSQHPEIRSARELLERWSREEGAPAPAAEARPAAPPASERIASNVPSPPAAAPAPPALPAAAVEKPAPTFADELRKAFPTSSDAVAALLKNRPTAASSASPPGSTGNDASAVIPERPVVAPPSAPSPSAAATTPEPAALPASAGPIGHPAPAGPPPRKMLDRPAMARTAKPKTVWRADSAHAPEDVPAAHERGTTSAPREAKSIALPLAAPSTPAPAPTPAKPSAPPVPAAPPKALFNLTPAESAGGVAQGTTPRRSAAAPAEAAARSERKTARSAKSTRQPPEADGSGTRELRPRRRVDRAESSTPAPHFDLQTYLAQNPQKVGRSESIWGQLVAYIGVAVLTIGTTMVLWGYFGGVARYTSTGFLVTTAGQMLLFLGVVTLVSGGMQQTSNEVSTRVEYLGERMIRMEQATQQVLRSPHFARRRRRAVSRQPSAVSDEERAA